MAKIFFSNVIAGTMTWGVWGKKLNTLEMARLMAYCVENNISSFDHADIYGDYTTEADFGKAFTASKIKREDIQLISKCGIQMKVENRSENRVKHYEYSKDYIIKSAEKSLQNLQTDYLDLLLLHRPSPLMQTDEIAAAVEKLKKEGKILDFGVSNFTPSQTALLQTKIAVHYNQIEFSVTALQAMIDGSLDFMQTHKIQAMCWSPMGKVFKRNDVQSERILNLCQKLSEKYNTPATTLLLAWILKHPAGILPVFGSTDFERIRDLQKATTISLELQDWFALWEASMGNAVA